MTAIAVEYLAPAADRTALLAAVLPVLDEHAIVASHATTPAGVVLRVQFAHPVEAASLVERGRLAAERLGITCEVTVRPAPTPRPSLTPHQREVLARIRRHSARNGVALSSYIGAPGACEHLLEKGFITREVARTGPRGGVTWGYRPTS